MDQDFNAQSPEPGGALNVIPFTITEGGFLFIRGLRENRNSHNAFEYRCRIWENQTQAQ